MSDPASSTPLPSPPLPSLDLNNTLGVLLITEILISVLFGIACVQVYMYFHSSIRDSSRMKGIVLFLWILDGLHLAFTSHGIYQYAVMNFTNPLALTQCPWSFSADMVFAELSDFILTSVFAYRIYKISGHMWPLIFIVPPQIVSLTAGLAIAVLVRKVPDYGELDKRYAWIWDTMFCLQAVADCAIAASLSTILVRRRTGFKRTNSLIRVLILYTIGTCTLTSSVSVASVITCISAPHNFIYFSIGTLLPKLTMNSLLALLNSRDALREMHAGQVVSVHFSKFASILKRSGTSDNAGAAPVHISDHISQEIIDSDLSATADILDSSFDSESQVPGDRAV
ncbi:uncharacterized protein PHACADRAFT_210804 [Phanerochaete carnosa HHB-10118-sp]|uniref:DUF6534 domain-containing protein n=1 Tax=Phanerochaete carnosa (strain HHB-10118-sp) TaxID=650164 RepID=K5W1T1_PHACS|nr:uncharacterized protein PHACADRAFT_210804 [Phanerochaete carnosa HHB-10118-sp]EKM53085.1 hypothetical protein PHACADRAFT_210804 [Phanerochaete carnosa HHB-10118-sp]